MRIAMALFLLSISIAAFGQEGPREPKVIKDAERMNDDVQSRHQYDASARALLSPKFRQAIETYKPGSANELLATWGEFVSADGKPFIALQLAPAGSASIKDGERLTLFGLLADDNGKTLATYNEPVSLAASKDDRYIERSFVVPLRRMTGTFGIARRNEVLGVTRIDFDPEPLTRATAGASRLIVSRDVHLLPEAQDPLDPFAFGGMKVVPRPGAAFRKSDEVWLFTELRNPSVGSDGTPHVQTKVELEGASRKIPGRFVPAEATPLKGVPGHYGIGNPIDISSLAPGDYHVRVTISDSIAKQSYKRETVIHIVK